MRDGFLEILNQISERSEKDGVDFSEVKYDIGFKYLFQFFELFIQ